MFKEKNMPVSINSDILRRIAEEEAQTERGGSPVPKGLYHLRWSATDSDTITVNGNPVMKPAAVIIGGAQVDENPNLIGRVVGTTLWWFSSADATKGKSAEERTATTRRISAEFFRALHFQVLGNPNADSSVVEQGVEQLDLMKTDDVAEAEELMVGLLSLYDGVDFYAYVAHRADRDDPSIVYANLKSPWLPRKPRGATAEETAGILLQAYEKAAEKVGVSTEVNL